MKKNVKADYIIVGCDLHEQSMRLKIAVDKAEPVTHSYANSAARRRVLIADLNELSAGNGGAPVVFAYEASSLGYALYDELTAAGVACHVIATTKVQRSPHHRRNKTDDTDAQQIFELLRGHLLAGNDLPTCTVPSPQTRDDREMTRMRGDVANKLTKACTQVTSLLKRNGIDADDDAGGRWTKSYVAWLKKLPAGRLAEGAGKALISLMRQIEFLREELQYWDAELQTLGQAPHCKAAVDAMTAEKGIGTVTAVTFLAELGDLSRFKHGKQVACYVGLVPSKHESGQAADRKGHITKQGPSRVRALLNQSAWASIRFAPWARAKYDRIVKRNPKKKKIAVVAIMRDLAERLWHTAIAAQRAAATGG